MPSTKIMLPAVSTLLAAAIAVVPYHAAFAVAPEPEEVMPDEPPPDVAADGGEEGGEPAEGADEGGEPAEGADEGGEPAADGGEDAGAEGGEDAGAEGGEDAGDEGGEPEPEPAAEPEPEPEETPPPASYVPEEEEDGRPEEPKVNGKAARGTGLMIAGGVTLGLGAAFTTTMALITRNCSFDGPLQCRLQNQDSLFIPMGVTTMVGGTIVLGLGVGFRLRYNKWERWTPGQEARLFPIVTRQTAGVGYTARF